MQHSWLKAILAHTLLPTVLIVLSGCGPGRIINGQFQVSFTFADGKLETATVVPIRSESISPAVARQIVRVAEPYVEDAVRMANLNRAKGHIRMLISGSPPYFVRIDQLSITEPDFSELSAAVEKEDIGQIRALVVRYRNVNEKEIPSQDTALAIAAAGGKFQSLRVLLALGADANLTNQIGTTPLMFAVLSGHEEAVRALVKAGANVNAIDLKGDSALSLAKSSHRDNLIPLLRSRRAIKRPLHNP